MAKTTTRKQPTDVVDLPMQVRAADFEPSSVDDEKRAVELVWAAGAEVTRRDWRTGEKYAEGLSMEASAVRLDRLNNGAPLLDTHNHWRLNNVVGVVERAWVANGEGRAIVRFSDRDEVEPIWRDVKSGIIRNVSVGYAVHKFEEERDPVTGALTKRTATDWEPMEISMVPIGADAGAGTRSQEETYPCEIALQRAAPAQEEDGMTGKNSQAPKGGQTAQATDESVVEPDNTRAQTTTTTTVSQQPDTDAAREEGAQAERRRQSDIRTAVRAAGLDDDFANPLIDDGITVEEARKKIIDKMGERMNANPQRSQHAVVIEDAADKWMRGAQNAIIQRAAVSHLFPDEKIEPGEFRGMTLVDMARDCLERSGVRTRGMTRMDLVGSALTHRSAITQSTSDFAVLLENTMHKVLQAQYMRTPDTWSRFCAVGSVSDFRPHNRYRLGMFGRLDAVNENGEFKAKAIKDSEKEQISAATVGNIINLSRQAIINDDLEAFNRLATMLGRAARLSVEIDVYALLAENSGLGPTMSDGKALFHADHNNIGTGSALTVEGIDGDRVVMASQKDPWGNEFLDLRPAALLVPISLGGTARVINDSQYDPDATNKLQKPNKVRGLFSDVVDTPRITGTRRYLFADPNAAPALEVAFLDGMQEPFLEVQDGFRVDGVEWKVRHDYGVAAIDYRGAVTNAGA